MRFIPSLWLGTLLLSLSLIASTGLAQQDELTIGSKAPALDIEHWVQDGNGKFKHVTEFEEGKVYIVEFWATWCGPCVASMPHISELQDEYADKGVQIISISDEDLETVEKFLERKVRGEEDKTYKELTSNYCLTCDPDGSSSKDYMEAAGQNGIPTAFIVGKTGEIEWIGHPVELNEPLEAVVADKWDREAYLEKMKEQKAFERKAQKVFRLLARGKEEAALEKLEEIIDDAPEEIRPQVMMMRFTLMAKTGNDRTAEVLKELAFGEFKDDGNALNHLAWTVVEMAEAGEDVSEELMEAASDAADLAVKADPEDASILDTQAHMAYLTGDVNDAIKIEEKAISFAEEGRLKEELTKYLATLKKKAAGVEEDGDDDDEKAGQDDDDDDDDHDDDDHE